MSGVWIIKDGVIRLVENPAAESSDNRRRVLVHTPTNEVINSYALLEQKLANLGWERYYDDPHIIQFHKPASVDLISLPRDFAKFTSVHMFDIVVKNRNEFRVRDA